MNSSDIPLNEPPELRAGLTWKWRREDLAAAGYPASTWTLKYWMKKLGSSGANFSIQATADGDNHAVTVAAATTSGYSAGSYAWAAEVSSGSEVYEVDRGTLKLLARYDQAANLDDRSHARIMLDAIEALLESRASVDQMEYTIGSRSLKRMAVKDLLEWRDYYRSAVGAEKTLERLRNGQGTGRIEFKL